jgi:hypothetical protein
MTEEEEEKKKKKPSMCLRIATHEHQKTLMGELQGGQQEAKYLHHAKITAVNPNYA